MASWTERAAASTGAGSEETLAAVVRMRRAERRSMVAKLKRTAAREAGQRFDGGGARIWKAIFTP